MKAENADGTVQGWHVTFDSHSVNPADEAARALPEWSKNSKNVEDFPDGYVNE